MPRFQLQPLDAPLPTVPQGPLSKLPRVDAPKAPTRYIEPSPPSIPTVGPGARPHAMRVKAAGMHGGIDPAAQPRLNASAASPGAGGAPGSQALYGFNIEELYDYDLPNIRSASATLTSMVGRAVNPAAAARADARASAKRHAPAEPELEGEEGDAAADGTGPGPHADGMVVEDVGDTLKVPPAIAVRAREGAGGGRLGAGMYTGGPPRGMT
jgi:hypothetical protein